MEEQIVAETDAVYCWPGPKMGMTVFSAKLGKMVLTDRRLLFLSAGKSGGAQLAAGAAGLPTFGGSQVSVSLDGDGGLEVPLAAVTRCEMGKKRALVVWHRNQDGSETAHAFGQRMGMPAGHDWVAQIDRLRGAATA
ncbi:hypothetical protein [Trujillonella humicola]|uniref:hypothetical protein n=1 Tax=Trujillonella humicola TaxID=3383699 RepID=UPI003906022B